MSEESPSPLTERDRIRDDTADHLRSLYTVAAGLSLAFALERMFQEGTDGINREDLVESSLPLLLAFIATLIPFFRRHATHARRLDERE